MGVDIVGGSPNRVITKQNAVGQALLGVSFSTVNGGASSWTEVTASTASDLLVTGAGFYIVGAGGTAVQAILQLEIGYGGSGAEVVLDTLVFMSEPGTTHYPAGWRNLGVPQRIGVAQRIAVRATQLTPWGSGYGIQVYLATVPTANLEAR